MSELNAVTRKQVKPKKNKVLKGVIIVLSIILVTLVCMLFSYQFVIKNFSGKSSPNDIFIEPGTEVTVTIPYGSSTSTIAGILEDKGLIHWPTIFKLMSRINGFDNTYQWGDHILGKKLSYTDMMKKLADKPINANIKVTIPEGWTYKQLLDELYSKKLIDKDKFNELADNENFDYKFLKDLPNRERRLEGYLFPETYLFNSVVGGEKDVIKIFLNQFNKVFTAEAYEKAKALNMTVDQVIILASIVEREARVPEERAIIAGIFYNRLKSKDITLRKLQSCATIQYILNYRDGKYKDTLLEEDTKIESPYNTYIHEGLPPGPICSPGEASINAALNPDDNKYYYFVTKDDGTGEHYFSKTFKEHLSAQAQAKRNASKK